MSDYSWCSSIKQNFFIAKDIKKVAAPIQNAIPNTLSKLTPAATPHKKTTNSVKKSSNLVICPYAKIINPITKPIKKAPNNLNISSSIIFGIGYKYQSLQYPLL